MTHDDACELVEQSLEKAVATLLHIRERLNKSKLTRTQWEKVKGYDILCNIDYYGAYLQGARKMYLALMDNKMFDIEYPDNGIWTSAKERKMSKNACLKLFLESTRNMEWLLHGIPQDVELVVIYERDKNGRAKSAKAEFRKKVAKYETV